MISLAEEYTNCHTVLLDVVVVLSVRDIGPVGRCLEIVNRHVAAIITGWSSLVLHKASNSGSMKLFSRIHLL
jgi:hypothetical protein